MFARVRPVLGWLCVLAAAAAVWLAWSARAAAQSEPDPAMLQQGGRIFAEQCATCHGASGQGGTIPGTDQTAPPLVGPDADNVTLAYTDLVMRTGRMPPPDNDPFDNRARSVTLTADERTAVNTYLHEQLGISGELPDVDVGDPSQGQRVFATNCAACHGSTGAGGVAGAGAWTPQVNHLDAVTVAEAVQVGPFEMPAFSEQQISDDEIGDIAAFLDEVEAETPTPLGLIELNPVLASGFAALFVLAVLLVVRIVAGKPTYFPDPEGQFPDDDAEARKRQP